MKSSIGSDAFALVALVAISAFVLLLIRHFLPLRTTPAYLTIPVFLALALPISIFLLVPIDLASSSGISDITSKGIWLPDTVLLVAWRLTYWLTFALTWIILPLLGEYTDSGYRTPKDRFLHSLRSNGRYQLIVFVCAGVGGIYVFLVNGFKTGSLKSLVIALAYCWGLVMAIYLMGHGLVAVPRKILRDANHPAKLRRLQSEAPLVHEKMTDATIDLEELEAQLTQLRKRKNAVSRDHEEWIEDISDISSIPDSRLSAAGQAPAPVLPVVITDRYLADFSRKLVRARHKRIRFEESWDRLVTKAIETQATIDSQGSRRLALELSIGSTRSRLTRRLHPYVNYILHAKILPAFKILFGGILALASVCIIWSEITKAISPKLSIVSLTVLSYQEDEPQIAFGGQVTASLWLLYMSLAALASFDDVKIWGNRALVRRNTYGESATWYSGQIAKLTVPLAYNFITLLPNQVYEKTKFFKFLGVLINLTPLGENFALYFPILILLPVLATSLNIYGRVKGALGFGFLVSDEEGNASSAARDSWREGRDLINREISTTRVTSSGRNEEVAFPLPSGHRSDTMDAPATPSASTRSLRQQPSQYSMQARQQADRLAEATAAAEEEDEGFFQGFAHRVKNTVDGIERPEWVNDLGRRPKWMTGVGGNSDSSGRAESGGGLGRWFGGRPADGRVRL